MAVSMWHYLKKLVSYSLLLCIVLCALLTVLNPQLASFSVASAITTVIAIVLITWSFGLCRLQPASGPTRFLLILCVFLLVRLLGFEPPPYGPTMLQEIILVATLTVYACQLKWLLTQAMPLSLHEQFAVVTLNFGIVAGLDSVANTTLNLLFPHPYGPRGSAFHNLLAGDLDARASLFAAVFLAYCGFFLHVSGRRWLQLVLSLFAFAAYVVVCIYDLAPPHSVLTAFMTGTCAVLALARLQRAIHMPEGASIVSTLLAMLFSMSAIALCYPHVRDLPSTVVFVAFVGTGVVVMIAVLNQYQWSRLQSLRYSSSVAVLVVGILVCIPISHFRPYFPHAMSAGGSRRTYPVRYARSIRFVEDRSLWTVEHEVKLPSEQADLKQLADELRDFADRLDFMSDGSRLRELRRLKAELTGRVLELEVSHESSPLSRHAAGALRSLQMDLSDVLLRPSDGIHGVDLQLLAFRIRRIADERSGYSNGFSTSRSIAELVDDGWSVSADPRSIEDDDVFLAKTETRHWSDEWFRADALIQFADQLPRGLREHSNSPRVVILTPKHMVAATFPTWDRREDTLLNGEEQITVDSGGEIRLRVLHPALRNSLGSSAWSFSRTNAAKWIVFTSCLGCSWLLRRRFSRWDNARRSRQRTASSNPPVSVFVSYRRDDSAYASYAIFEVLNDGIHHEVIMDVESIPLGTNFRSYIAEAITQCDVTLVVIGDGWLESRQGKQSRRLDDPHDYVRFEIEKAFEHGVKVVPVLVNNASMPEEEDLPSSIRQLAKCNAAEVRPGSSFRGDVVRLASSLASLPRRNAPPI